MTISYEKYEEELKLFVSKWNSVYLDEQWKIGKKHTGLYAELKYLDETDNLWLHFFIIYSQSYAVPELWFNVYTPGSIQQRLPIEKAVRAPEFVSKCSEDEHRFLGIAFFYVDPCRILQAIQDSVKSCDPDYMLNKAAELLSKSNKNYCIVSDGSWLLVK
uniref:Uncharacterized protein n=1 Tax=Panagrolaimus sp. JU765 TaxID=591449 RepID=A0AC34QYY2_9BILA